MLKKLISTKEFGIFALLFVVCLGGELRTHNFLSAVNLSNEARMVGIYGIFSLGMGLVIITGGIDLSVGSMFALLGVLLVIMLHDKQWPWTLAIPLTLLGGALLGWIHGLLITKVKIQPFVVTLCAMMFYRGMASYIAGDSQKGFEDDTYGGLKDFLTNPIGGHLPVQFLILIVLAAITAVFLHRGVFGRYLFAVGRNEDAARFSGINTDRIITSAYVISGFFASITAVLLAFYTNSVQPSTHGQGYELYGIAAAVLGGCSLRGGEGSIIGILIGTVLLQVIQNLVNLCGIPSTLNFSIMGAVVLIGVIADQLVKNRKPRTAAPVPAAAPAGQPAPTGTPVG